MTWATQPTSTTTLLGQLTIDRTLDKWYELDVTSYLQARPTEKRLTLLLTIEGTASAGSNVQFASREATSSQPELLITTAP
jgi:hypothetical protein